MDAGCDLFHVGMERVTDDQPLQPFPETLGRVEVGRVGREVPDLHAVLMLFPEGREAFGVMGFGIVADEEDLPVRILREQPLQEPLEGLRREVRRRFHRGGPPADIHGAKERDARMVAIGRDLFLVAAEEPCGRDGLISPDMALVLEEDYRVRRGVFFTVSRRSWNAVCSVGRARFSTEVGRVQLKPWRWSHLLKCPREKRTLYCCSR